MASLPFLLIISVHFPGDISLVPPDIPLASRKNKGFKARWGRKIPLIPRGFFYCSQKISAVPLIACFIRKKTLAPLGATGVVLRHEVAWEIVLDNKIMSNTRKTECQDFLGTTSKGRLCLHLISKISKTLVESHSHVLVFDSYK